MVLAPGALETEIQIAERGAERNRPDVALRGWRRGFQNAKGAGDFVGLMGDPFLRAFVRFPQHLFIALQHRRVADPVGERLRGQRTEARLRLGRDDFTPASQPVEIFDDDGAVEQNLAVLEDQGRNLSKRVLLSQRIFRVVRVGDGNLDTVR